MRKLLIGAAVAGAALAAASPAAAQYYGGQPYGYGYGYDYREVNNRQVQALAARINEVQRQVEYAAARRMMPPGAANRFRQEIQILARDVRRASRYPLSRYEVSNLNARISGLEQRTRYSSRNPYRGYGNNGYGGYNRGYSGGYDSNGYYDDGPLGDGIDDENN